MIETRYLEFYNYFGKFRELPLQGLFIQKFQKDGEGANENLPFFIHNNKSYVGA